MNASVKQGNPSTSARAPWLCSSLEWAIVSLEWPIVWKRRRPDMTRPAIRRCFRSGLTALLLLGMNALLVSRARACSCIWLSIPVQIQQANYIFVGTVPSADTASVMTARGFKVQQYVATLDVETVWKGAVTRRFRVESSALGTTCGIQLRVGERYVVYAYDSDMGGLLAMMPRTDLCTRTHRLVPGDLEPSLLDTYLGTGRTPVSTQAEVATSKEALIISSNPVRSTVRVRAPSAAVVMLYDLLGRVRGRAEGHEVALDMSSFPNGLYIIRVVTSSGSYSRAVVRAE